MKSVKGKGLAFFLVTIIIMSVLMIPLKVTAQDKLPDFKDVPKTAWYYDYVSSLADLGIVKGYGNSGEFRPMNLLTREHATKMILLASQVDHRVKCWRCFIRPGCCRSLRESIPGHLCLDGSTWIYPGNFHRLGYHSIIVSHTLAVHLLCGAVP